MPIVLNGRVVQRPRITGVERLAREITVRLLRSDPELYELLSPPPGSSDKAGHAWEQFVLPVRSWRRHAPLLYSPSNLAPIAWPRNVVVLHDASVWRTPDSFSSSYTSWHRRLEAIAARRAVGVITVSEFSRGELVDVLGLDPDALAVVPNGVEDRFAAGTDPEPVRRRHGLDRPYVLTVASDQGRKNLPLLNGLARRLVDDGIAVVWAGGREAGRREPGAPVMLGYVSDADLPGLYAGAEAFVLPSRYEGFGITCVEAMASGTPVVAADRSALPETCAGAAVLADPDDEDGFVDAVVGVLADAALRERLRVNGRRRASELTWERAAEQTDDVLRRLAVRLQ